MKSKKRLELKEKGWSEEEIKKAESILEQEKEHDVHFSKIVFWSALVVIIFANLLVSLILIPFLIVFNQLIIYPITALLGGTIGFLYNFLITDIGHLKSKNHLVAGFLVPLIALANMMTMVFVSNRFITEIKIKNSLHNPWIIAGIFAVAFILPTIFYKLFKKS
jgi:hypothetical protein